MSRPDDHELVRRESALPPPPAPVANYVAVRESAGMLFVAGQTPHVNGLLGLRGRVGAEVSEAEGREQARVAALNVLAALHAHVGSLREIGGIVSVTGFVACAPGFVRHPAVIDGASDVFVEHFGSDGVHARAAVGVASLPDGAPVELSVIALRR